MQTLCIHDVVGVRVREPRRLEKSNIYVRHIEIVTEDGMFDVTLFTKNAREAIELSAL